MAAAEPPKAIGALEGQADIYHRPTNVGERWQYRAGEAKQASRDAAAAIATADKHAKTAIDSIGDAANLLANYEPIDGAQVLHLAFTEPQWEAYCEGARILENLGAFDLDRTAQVEVMARLVNHVPLDMLRLAYRDVVMEMTDVSEAVDGDGDTELDEPDESEEPDKIPESDRPHAA
jgi:hypothetical protein